MSSDYRSISTAAKKSEYYTQMDLGNCLALLSEETFWEWEDDAKEKGKIVQFECTDFFTLIKRIYLAYEEGQQFTGFTLFIFPPRFREVWDLPQLACNGRFDKHTPKLVVKEKREFSGNSYWTITGSTYYDVVELSLESVLETLAKNKSFCIPLTTTYDLVLSYHESHFYDPKEKRMLKRITYPKPKEKKDDKKNNLRRS